MATSRSQLSDLPEPLTVTISEYLNAGSEKLFAEAEETALQQPGRRVCLNFNAASGMDGAGLQLLAIFAVKMVRHGFVLSAAPVPTWLQQIFHLTHLDTLFSIYRSTKRRLPAAAASENAQWSPFIDNVNWPGVPAEANAVNTRGRAPLPPFSGFGPLWQRTYRVALPGVQPIPRAGDGPVARQLLQLLAARE